MEEEVHTLRYKLCKPSLDEGAMLAQSYLHMPSGSRTFDNVKWSCPLLVMSIKDPDDMHCLALMMSCSHINILHAKVVRSEDSCNVAWTEPFTGSLLALIKRINLADFTGMLPSPQLKSIVSQLFDGIRYLRRSGKYHGAFSLANTYYDMGPGMPVPKLTNFREKGKSLKFENRLEEIFFLTQCQVEDAWDIADGLDEICAIADKWNKANRLPPLDCSLVIDLAKRLREVSKDSLVSDMEDIKRHMFFWDEDDIGRFYISDLPSALRNSDFRDDVEASSICNIPWDADQHAGLLQSMNHYRKLNNLPPYDGTKKTQFCSFCSGLYTHEFELPPVKFGGLRVHKVLKRSHPKACFEMVRLMPNGEKKYMLSKREEKKILLVRK